MRMEKTEGPEARLYSSKTLTLRAETEKGDLAINDETFEKQSNYTTRSCGVQLVVEHNSDRRLCRASGSTDSQWEGGRL